MPTKTWQSTLARLGGEDLRKQREAAGYTRPEFARAVGQSPRTIEAWEAKGGHVPSNKIEMVRDLLRRRADDPDALTNMDLLAIVAQRFAAYEDMAGALLNMQQGGRPSRVMITGKQLLDQRTRKGKSREELAADVGVHFRSIGNWERSHVPASKVALVWDVLFAADYPADDEAQRSDNDTPTPPVLPGLQHETAPTRGTAGRIRPRTSKGAINAHQDASDV